MTAEPRTGTLLVVRPDSESPGVVFTTRHVLGGAVEVANERVTDGGAALEFDLSNPAGHEVTVYFSSRETPLSVPSPADATLAAGPCPDVWAVTFTPVADTTPVTISFVQAQ